jgi:spermidine synthase
MMMRHLLCSALLARIAMAVEVIDTGNKIRHKFDVPDTSCHPEESSNPADESESSCTLEDQFDSFLFEECNLPFDLYTCPFGRNMRFPGYFEYEPVDSMYQDILFYTDIETKKDKDTCFDLDGTVQICGSYRPHYHELVVHYPARYVETVKRVVWVGGGDSMLLHEVLKYPTLELVIGLELDQSVTRNSFKHFGTQPHWDNDKVEWWFGDASKSLMMLPKDYFGSFDLVLVDLSETVMSLSVTEHLDIFGALALLLTKEGIIVKNELYLEHFSEIFDYTMQVHAYDIPVICSQAVALGSYGNDYLTKTPVNHGVDMIYKAMLDNGTYHDWHDYRRNDTNTQAHCKEEEPETKLLVDQERSPGILMIIEAEEVTIDLTSLDSVKDILVKALEKEDLTVQSFVLSSPDDVVIAAAMDQTQNEKDGVVGQVAIVLQEGYVVARVWAAQKYIAFDLHLWSEFDHQENVHKALLSAVGNSGGKTSSSYRIVAGGMFGMSDWKKEEANRGPRRTHECDRRQDKESSRVMAVETSSVVTMLTESINIIQDKDIVVAVFCGAESKPCVSVDVVKQHEKVATVVPIYTCPVIRGINEYMEDEQQRMVACQKEMVDKLYKSLPADELFRGIVVDGGVPFAMGQLIHKIFRIQTIKDDLLNTDDCMVLANIESGGESWRRNFLDRFRRDILTDDPIFRAEILFNSTDTTMEMGIVNIGDGLFVEKLMEAVAKIETATGLVSDVRNIQGGMFTFMPDFEASQFSLPGEYDQSSPFEQWNAQQPLGHQTVLQLELYSEVELEYVIIAGTRVEVTYDEDESYHGTVVEVMSNRMFNVLFDDGEHDDQVAIEDIRPLEIKTLNRGDLEPLSTDMIKGLLKKTILAMKTEDDIGDDDVKVLDFKSVGEGCVFISFWSGGSVLLLWDGRKHVDLNLFTYKESVAFSKGFGSEFGKTYPLLKAVLRDEQPRGVGRVVNFVRDLGEPRDTPHWSM